MAANGISLNANDRSEREPRYRTASGRMITYGQRVAAAHTRVAADKKRGASTPEWIVALASSDPDRP